MIIELNFWDWVINYFVIAISSLIGIYVIKLFVELLQDYWFDRMIARTDKEIKDLAQKQFIEWKVKVRGKTK